MRKLSPDEAALWRKVAATIRPLGSETAADSTLAPQTKPLRALGPAAQRPPSKRPLAIGDSLDGGWDKRLRSGAVEPDRTLDLHGLNLDTAWAAIDRLLDRSWQSGDRLILLVTGRERPDSDARGRGRIRAAVRNWLAASRHAPHIAAIRPAHKRHGGAGSVYIVLRRH